MKVGSNALNRRFALVLGVFLCVAAQVNVSKAQFSQPVVVLKGTIRGDESGKPVSVKLSVRVVGDTAQEITGSRSNSETGNYLVVLKAGKKYWIHLEGDQIITKDTLIETPKSDRYMQVVHDFVVTTREREVGTVDPAARKESSPTASPTMQQKGE